MSGETRTPRRIQQRRTKGWRMPANTVSVARPSRWGNWYKVTTVGEKYQGSSYIDALPDPDAFLVVHLDKWGGRTGPQWGGFADKAEATAFAVELHRRALLATRSDLDGLVHHKYYLGELRGKDLACWCPLDQPCHADVLLDLANRDDH